MTTDNIAHADRGVEREDLQQRLEDSRVLARPM